ncbi:hypothetical protein, partial [Nostoc sp.]
SRKYLPSSFQVLYPESQRQLFLSFPHVPMRPTVHCFLKLLSFLGDHRYNRRSMPYILTLFRDGVLRRL